MQMRTTPYEMYLPLSNVIHHLLVHHSNMMGEKINDSYSSDLFNLLFAFDFNMSCHMWICSTHYCNLWLGFIHIFIFMFLFFVRWVDSWLGFYLFRYKLQYRANTMIEMPYSRFILCWWWWCWWWCGVLAVTLFQRA